MHLSLYFSWCIVTRGAFRCRYCIYTTLSVLSAVYSILLYNFFVIHGALWEMCTAPLVLSLVQSVKQFGPGLGSSSHVTMVRQKIVYFHTIRIHWSRVFAFVISNLKKAQLYICNVVVHDYC